MKRNFLIIVFLVMFYPIFMAQNQPATPKLICTVPAFGDCDVDTGMVDIIFKFDQEMNSGMTFGKTSNFPELNGKPKWIDAKILSLPVRLYPNRRYSIVLNNTFPMRFASTLGMTLNPDELLFQTKPDHEVKPGIKSNLNKIVLDGQFLPTKYLDAVEYNYNHKAVSGMLQDVRIATTHSGFAGKIGNVGYISIGSWTIDPNTLKYKTVGDTLNVEASFEDVLSTLTRLPNLIIDVRSNSGGNEQFARDFASRFIKKSTPYEKVMNYNNTTFHFDMEHIKILEPSAKQINYTGKIYILSGPSVFSSNESFVLMMKKVQNAKVVGMKTYGGSGNPIPHKLSNGVIVNLPSWLAYTLDGKLIEGNGVEPDIEIPTKKSDFATKDALLESVLLMINKK